MNEDCTQGDLLAEEAIQQAEAHADKAWLDAARRTVARLAELGIPFTTDAVWEQLDALDVHTHEPRALGAVMRQAARDGLLTNSGRYVKSTRADCHSRPVPVWLPRKAEAA